MLSLGIAAILAAQSVTPGGFTEEPFATAISSGTSMAFAPDGRLFVAQQTGLLRVFSPAGAAIGNFHSFTSMDSTGERGLLGIAFDPNFTSNFHVYAYYTSTTPAVHNRVVRLTANGDVSTGTETLIVQLDNLSAATNHNGGALHFGTDGKLYIAVGENATPANAQSVANRHGKILRLNPDGSIPADNPASFTVLDSGGTPSVASPAGANRAIWALGLRNPFTFAVQPGSGRIFINDVGAASWEEINDGIAGSNYGWRNSTTDGPTANTNDRDPLYAFPHSGGPPTGCAITGGAFYNPSLVQFPATYLGRYFFSDLCGNWIYTYDPGTGAIDQFATGLLSPVDIDVGPEGALYYLNRNNNAVRRIRYTGVITQGLVVSTNTLSATEGSSASFNVRLAADPGATPVSVTVAVTMGDPSVSVTTPMPLSFTTGNWSVYQNVAVAAAVDADASDDGATLSVSAAGLNPQAVVVTALDIDRPPGSPTSRITIPANGQTVSGATAEFFGDGSDNSAVSQAEFYVDGLLISTDVGNSGHYHVGGSHNGWNTTTLSNGPHVLRMTVRDDTLPTALLATHEITVVVSNAPPPPPGNGGSGGRCGLSGVEVLAVLSLLALLRRRRGH